MGLLERKTAWEKEWQKLKRQEERFLKKHAQKKDTFLNQTLEGKIPDKLQDTLDAAFIKAFGIVFQKGTGVIEKTYRKEKREKNYKVREYAADVQEDRRTLRAFSRNAQGTGSVNLLLSGVSGVGLGVLGIGVPDIALLTAMMLKSIYEIALSYGYDYESEEERYFILLLLQGAVSYGQRAETINRDADGFIRDQTLPEHYDQKEQIRETAALFSRELLYLKFLQGIPVVGAVGGAYNTVYMKRVTEYANLKYKRRFLSGRAELSI
ncbi:EcsC family protein [Anaerovorax odorimutans]|uniref:EcsC family protein n=1 Tax=Anaerovorax odorimutans TaxID=109327 RepID=A0ABT1RRY4_9FIRM|nr:EcsC family protein [Anaerovorax odorimutans]MCQ4637965.1 EcsC family protein [Anaerovorax odorimutans]